MVAAQIFHVTELETCRLWSQGKEVVAVAFHETPSLVYMKPTIDHGLRGSLSRTFSETVFRESLIDLCIEVMLS